MLGASILISLWSHIPDTAVVYYLAQIYFRPILVGVLSYMGVSQNQEL